MEYYFKFIFIGIKIIIGINFRISQLWLDVWTHLDQSKL